MYEGWGLTQPDEETSVSARHERVVFPPVSLAQRTTQPPTVGMYDYGYVEPIK